MAALRPVLAALAAGVLAAAGPALAATATPPQPSWNFSQVHVEAARPAGHSGAGVTVAVLDSWIDGTHNDFQGRVLAGADCTGGSCKPGPAASDACDHGTHVAGTIASSSYGVAPQALVLPVRVLTYDSSTGDCVGQPADVANGINWAVAQGARILNLSLGGEVPGLTSSTAIPDAVAAAAQAGAVVVFSAGNANAAPTDSYGSNALVVAATGPSGGLASYSQRGAGVSLAAPGGDPRTPGVCHQDDCITSLYPGNRYAVAAGTSMAAPHVSGVAALLLAQDPHRTRQQIESRLTGTARPLAGAGAGLLDAAAALGVRAAPPRAPATTAPAPPTVQLRTEPQPVPVHRPAAAARRSPAATPPATAAPLSAPTAPATATPGAGPPLAAVPAMLPAPRAGRALPGAPVGAAVGLAVLACLSLATALGLRRR